AELPRRLLGADGPEDDFVVRLQGAVAVARSGLELAGALVVDPLAAVAIDGVDGPFALHRHEVRRPRGEPERSEQRDHEGPDSNHRQSVDAPGSGAGALCTGST